MQFTAQYSPTALFIRTDFSLANIGSVELEEQSDSRRTTTSIAFRSPAGRRVIHTVRQQGQFLSLPPKNTSEDVNVFRWPLGYTCPGCPNSHKEIGERLVKAFVNAVKLCGGGEPF